MFGKKYLEAFLDGFLLNLIEGSQVSLINQLVTIHSISLVQPQANELQRCFTTIRPGKQKTLQNMKSHCDVKSLITIFVKMVYLGLSSKNNNK